MSFVERLTLLFNTEGVATAVGGVKEVSSAAQLAGVHTSGLDSALGRLGLSGKVSSEALQRASVVGVGAMALGIAKLTADGVRDFERLGGSILHFSQVSGQSAEEASRWVAVADDYQVSAETLSTTLGRLGKNVATNDATLTALGVTVRRTGNGSVDLAATFLDVVDAINTTTDAATQNAIGTAAFGRGWQSLANLISQGSDKIRDSLKEVSGGQIFSEADLKKAEELRLSMDHLSDAFRDFKMELADSAMNVGLGALADGVGWVLDKANRLHDALGDLGQGLGRLVGVSYDSDNATKNLAETLGSATAAEHTFGSATENAAAELRQLAAESMSAVPEIEAVVNALANAANAAADFSTSQVTLTRSQDKVAEVQERLANGGRTLAEIQSDQASGSSSAASQAKALESAQRGVADATERVAEETDQLTKRTEATKKAQQDLTDALERQRKATDALNDAKAFRPENMTEPGALVEDAKRREAGAVLDVADAEDRARQAHDAYTAAQGDGTDARKLLQLQRDAQRADIALADSKRSLEQATKNVNQRAAEYTATDIGLYDATGNLTEAQNNLETANRDVERATEGAKSAAEAQEQQERQLRDAIASVEDANRRVLEAQTARDSGSGAHHATIKTTKELEDDLQLALDEVARNQQAVITKAGEYRAAQIAHDDYMNGTTTPAWVVLWEKMEAMRLKADEIAGQVGEGKPGYEALKAYSGLLSGLEGRANAGTIGNYPGAYDLIANPADYGYTPAVANVTLKIDATTLANILVPIIRSSDRTNG